jgi:hypothetical protein
MTRPSPPETTFTLTIDDQDIQVRYQPYAIGGRDPYAILEFSSPHQPRRPTPLSKNGYSSFFAPMNEIADAPSIEKYACMVALLLARELAGSVNRSAPSTPL